MTDNEAHYLREVQYRFPDRLEARAVLHRRYGRDDWFAWLAEEIAFTPGSVVADVGCGAGALWRSAPRTVPDDLVLRLIDTSPGMVTAAEAAARAAAGRWRDVEAVVGDAVALPLANGGVDTALAIHMLYHLADPAAGLAELARVTRPGGTVAVVLNRSGTMAELSGLVERALGRPSARPAPLSSEDGMALMQEQFGEVEVRRYDDTLRVTDPVDLLGYLTSLPEAETPGAVARLAAAVDAAFGTTDAFIITKTSDLLLARR
ncbi:class I SAM-dependent methyltransferase [Sphingomonas sp. 8AM]|uniref:class I SAM-dependent methyltransferase n=1 Tax=Sphingomonas sp. 8AM TaxID=2653170 RepID=UPI0012EF2544|nr:class I SAM-dependent methyltransferase [Sphingomonas sp. 8AM]VXC82768.1 Class I SAM-dependent methyltransferase [Sphingomonas sp. 8AM]